MAIRRAARPIRPRGPWRRCSSASGQPIVIQNRPGAAALIGTQAVANAPPDGYTITIATTQLSAPGRRRGVRPPPNFTRDQFAPIALVSADPSLLFVNATQPGRPSGYGRRRQEAVRTIVYASGGLYGDASRDRDRAQGHRHQDAPPTDRRRRPAPTGGNHAALLAAHPAVGGPQARRRAAPARHHGDEAGRELPRCRPKELGYDAEYYQWNGVFTQAKVPEPIITIYREAIAKAVKDPNSCRPWRASAAASTISTGMRSAPGGTPTARRPKKPCAPSAGSVGRQPFDHGRRRFRRRPGCCNAASARSPGRCREPATAYASFLIKIRCHRTP